VGGGEVCKPGQHAECRFFPDEMHHSDLIN
jgi:hypothetical protein